MSSLPKYMYMFIL